MNYFNTFHKIKTINKILVWVMINCGLLNIFYSGSMASLKKCLFPITSSQIINATNWQKVFSTRDLHGIRIDTRKHSQLSNTMVYK